MISITTSASMDKTMPKTWIFKSQNEKSKRVKEVEYLHKYHKEAEATERVTETKVLVLVRDHSR